MATKNKKQLEAEVKFLGLDLPEGTEEKPVTNRDLQELIDDHRSENPDAAEFDFEQWEKDQEAKVPASNEPVADGSGDGETTPKKSRGSSEVAKASKENMKATAEVLSHEAQVEMEIPLEIGEEVGKAFQEVTINGVKERLPKGELIRVSLSVYEVLKNRRDQLSKAGRRAIEKAKLLG